MSNIVVDTSVIIKWFCVENDSAKAKNLLQMVAQEEVFLSLPESTQLEVANIFRVAKRFPEEETSRHISDFFRLWPEFVEIDEHLTLQISNLSYTYDIASYDSAFIAVANEHNIPLMTADYQHHRKEISPNIVWLSEWNGKWPVKVK